MKVRAVIVHFVMCLICHCVVLCVFYVMLHNFWIYFFIVCIKHYSQMNTA